ncbi:MAG: hypothetical protein EBZ89_05445, partial [Chloroflexi bacterium]|nr:hypothetical protein [Chloroflexota bacterium]
MPSLSNRTVSSSYTELLKINETNGLTSILARVEDGDGTFSALSLSTSKIRSDGDLEVTGTSNLWTLDVTDTSTLRGDVSMAGNLTVAGNAVIQGTLTANGGTLTFG